LDKVGRYNVANGKRMNNTKKLWGRTRRSSEHVWLLILELLSWSSI
jgi:hypothetical protein